jgi:hypothetical protein
VRHLQHNRAQVPHLMQDVVALRQQSAVRQGPTYEIPRKLNVSKDSRRSPVKFPRSEHPSVQQWTTGNLPYRRSRHKTRGIERGPEGSRGLDRQGPQRESRRPLKSEASACIYRGGAESKRLALNSPPPPPQGSPEGCRGYRVVGLGTHT